MTPLWFAVAVDDRGADAFQKIRLRKRAEGEAVFNFQRGTQGRGRAKAVLHLDGAGGGQRAGAQQGLEGVGGKVSASNLEARHNRRQRRGCEKRVDLRKTCGQCGGGRRCGEDSASVVTRNAMDQLVVDNLKAWFAGKPPLTPVAETPVKGR